MRTKQNHVVYRAVVIVALAGAGAWYVASVTLIAAESASDFIDAAISFEGILVGLRSLVLVLIVVFVLRFLVLADSE